MQNHVTGGAEPKMKAISKSTKPSAASLAQPRWLLAGERRKAAALGDNSVRSPAPSSTGGQMAAMLQGSAGTVPSLRSSNRRELSQMALN